MAQKSFIKRIISSPLVQTFVIYVSGGWIALEMTDYIINKYGLDERISDVLPIIILIGLPVAIFLAWYLSRDTEEGIITDQDVLSEESLSIPEDKTPRVLLSLRSPQIIFSGILIIIAIVITVFFRLRHQSKITWAKEEILPKIEKLLEDKSTSSRYWIGFDLAKEAAQYIPDDPLLNRLLSSCSQFVNINSDPQGTKVYAKSYADINSDWRYMGITPIDSLRFPGGYCRLKFEKEGFTTAYDITHPFLISNVVFRLQEAGSLPEEMGMVYYDSSWYQIPGGHAGLHFPGLEHLEMQQFSDFLMDRYEITNEQYKNFVDDGGYQKLDYWNYPFHKDGRTLDWKEAMKLFTDKTGRPGPATWEVGVYPDGQGDYPVSGVSWYEAAAYAAYASKDLPTIYHWDLVALTWASSEIIPLSNLNNDNPTPVGSSGSMNRYGIFDMSGNVREWSFNKRE